MQQKATLEEDFYPDANNLQYGFYSKVPESKIDALVDDLKSQYVALLCSKSPGCELGAHLSFFLLSSSPFFRFLRFFFSSITREDKRKEFSRRRRYDETQEVDYINERNQRFNKKIARAFDPYTKDIKQNLERGTAI